MNKNGGSSKIGRLVEWEAHLTLFVVVCCIGIGWWMKERSPEVEYKLVAKGDQLDNVASLADTDGGAMVLALAPSCPYCLMSMSF